MGDMVAGEGEEGAETEEAEATTEAESEESVAE